MEQLSLMKPASALTKRFARVALAVVLVDLAAIVISGGVSFLGPVGASGFFWRVVMAAVFLALDFFRRGFSRSAYLHAYVGLLVVLLAILHFRGYRLRGDGLWYYCLAHSLAFDFDVRLANQ
ncbi:MAG TPA: hypothetical protein VIG29_12675, partial [Vicinamibacteria bacterium]